MQIISSLRISRIPANLVKGFSKIQEDAIYLIAYGKTQGYLLNCNDKLSLTGSFLEEAMLIVFQDAVPDIKVNFKGFHKLMKGLKSFKPTGPDSIPSFVLKAAIDEFAPTLTRIYQTSLGTGQIPSDWKDAWTVSVFKKEDKHKAVNYRPVSLTSIAYKLLELIVHSRQASSARLGGL